MTTLILAQKRILSLQLPFLQWDVAEHFSFLNKRGIFTLSIFVLAGILVGIYLVSLYLSFFYGFEIQTGNTAVRSLEKAVLERELILQERIKALAGENYPVLKSMEKVSTIRYLTSENVAVSKPELTP